MSDKNPCLLYRIYQYCTVRWPERYSEAVEDVVAVDEESDSDYLAKPWQWNHYFDCEGDWIEALEKLQ